MKYNSPFMKFLETVANMLIVSFFWVVCSLPVLTIIPSTVALYHTTNKVIFNGNGKGVVKDFFKTFKDNFVQSLKVNVIVVIMAAVIIIGMNTALQIYTWNFFGLLYLILGLLISFVCATMLVYIPAVISKFYLRIGDTFRLAAYFASVSIGWSILNVLLLVAMYFIVDTIPLALMIVPALYIDFIRGNIEKRMNQFIIDNNLKEEIKEEINQEVNNDEISASEIIEKLEKGRKKDKNAKH